MLKTAPMAASAASTASTVSKAPMARGAEAEREGAGAEGALAGAGADGRATEVPGRDEVPVELGDGGTGGAGRPPCVAGAAVAVARAAAGAAVAAAGAAPVGGRDGSLMVGAEVGLGGSAMRTVSFFGCTFAASAGFGGTGESGVGSDINLLWRESRGAGKRCQTVNPSTVNCPWSVVRCSAEILQRTTNH